ncbi:MAG: FHA domain-containing protein [Firmicutes bacterium]|nr:FHA domain-containing protein [Bacillota bacterium]
MYDSTMESTVTTAAVYIYLILSLLITAAIIVGIWKMFEKAGEGGWKSLIPFYNMYILYKISWGNGLLFLLLFLPIIDIVMIIVTPFKTAKAYGLHPLYGVGLLLLPVIFYPVIGLGSSKYIGPDGKPEGNTYVINQYNYNGVTPQPGMPGGPQPAPADNANAGGDALEKLGNSMESLKDGVSNLFKNRAEADQEVRDQYSYQQPAADDEYRFCTNCGARIKKTAKFCTNCGKEVSSLMPDFAPEPAPDFAPTPEPEPAMDPFGFTVEDSKLDDTVMTETELMDYGEKTEILLDDPVVIIPALTMISEDDEGEKEEIRVSDTPFVIGRTTANADYALDARGISRRHLQFDYEDGTYYVTDLNSTNGVFVNDTKIPAGERSIVENNDIIGIGQRRYRVEVQQLS